MLGVTPFTTTRVISGCSCCQPIMGLILTKDHRSGTVVIIYKILYLHVDGTFPDIPVIWNSTLLFVYVTVNM